MTELQIATFVGFLLGLVVGYLIRWMTHSGEK